MYVCVCVYLCINYKKLTTINYIVKSVQRDILLTGRLLTTLCPGVMFKGGVGVFLIISFSTHVIVVVVASAI